MMGTSLLSLPWAFAQSGFALGVFMVIFMGAICLYTCYLVLKSTDSVDKSKYEALEFTDVCEYHLGKTGKYSSVCFSLIALLGATTVYLVLLSNFLYNVGTFIYDHTSTTGSAINTTHHVNYSNFNVLCLSTVAPTNAHTAALTPSGAFFSVWQKQQAVPFFLLLILLPLSSFKSPTFFTKFNALGTISVFYIIAFVCIKSGSWGFHLSFKSTPEMEKTPLYNYNFPALTGTLGLALYIHNAILSIVRNQEKPQNNARDICIAYSLTTGTYFLISVIFYSCFPLAKRCIEQVLLDNFPAGDVMTFVARICLLFQMITVFPLLMYIIRVQTFATIYKKTYPSWLHVLVLNLVVIGIGILFAIVYPHVGHIIRYVGSISGLAYIFTLPCVVHLMIQKEKKSLTWTSTVLHSTLILLGVMNLIAQFMI